MILIYILLSIANSFEFFTTKRDAKLLVISNNSIAINFQEQSMLQTQCHPTIQYGESFEKNSTLFTFTNNDSIIHNISLNVMSSNTDAVQIKQGINVGHQMNIEQNKSQDFLIEYECVNTQVENWSIINLQLNVNDDKYDLYYFKLCQGNIILIQYNIAPEQFIHPLIILLMLAIAVVALGAQYGLKELKLFGTVQQEEFNTKTTIFFIMSSSLLLIFLFKFPQIGQLILTVMVTIMSFFAIQNSILEVLNNFIQYTTINKVFAYTISSGLIISYILTKNWLLSNVLALATTLLMFRIIEIDTCKTGTLLLFMAFFYDIFWVFVSSVFFNESVMAAVATGIDLPIKFVCPSLLHSYNTPLLRCSLLGLGDILLPGIVIKYVLKFEQLLNRGYSIFFSSIIGYGIGLSVCLYFLIIFHLPQPALLYIVPCLLLSIFIASLRKGVFLQLWRGEVFRVGTSAPKVEHAYELTGDQL